MIQVTERAIDGLKQILDTSRAPSDQGVKLVPAETGGLGMTIAPAAEDNVVIEGGRKPLLILDPEMAGQLQGAVLDLTPTDGEEPRFVLRREEAADPGPS
jgi:hypothetical protein